MHISIAREISDELLEAFQRLTPQLSTATPPGQAELEQIVSTPLTSLLIARDPDVNGKIVGSLTLVAFRIPTGMRAWIEDVIVDDANRGKGVGEALTRAALDCARELGCKTVDLTSRPSREAANRLYRRVGFEQRETNLYRYKL
jgi:ribosomal protein S18 acetylase RimI-like enzyme